MKNVALLFLFLAVGGFEVEAQSSIGLATVYDDRFEGRQLASGERYQRGRLTAAHPYLAFGTMIELYRTDTGDKVVVVVNDRGPYIRNHVVALSGNAADILGINPGESAPVRLQVLGLRGYDKEVKPGDNEKDNTAKSTDSRKSSSSKSKINLNDPKVPSSGIYKVSSEKIDKVGGFGVQVGFYSSSSYPNLMKQVALLEKAGYDNVLIINEAVKKDATKSKYKLVLGPFNDRKAADKFKREISRKGLKGFVIELKP